MTQLIDWLGPFIEEEIRSVIAWKHAIESNSEVKVEPNTRFSDDGSNFRSIVDLSVLPSDPRIQISEICSIEDPVTLFVTDGFTRVKAKLSENAIATLKAGLGEAIELDVRGDVLSIREATVESTPYGPTDGWIQLAVDELEYLFHLRKSVGQPKPIEERAETNRLVKEIENLRLRQYQDVEPYQHSSPDRRHVSQMHSSPASGRFRKAAEDETPKSQRSVGISQNSSPALNISPNTQRQIATQIPSRHRPNGPTLMNDGLEIKEGVNLSRPIQPNSSGANREPSNAFGMSPATNQTGTKLLSLLGKRKADTTSEPNQPSQAPLVSQNSASLESTRREATSALNPRPETASMLPDSPPNKRQISPVQRKARDYRRRKIPPDQRKLLDKDSSWFPSQTGQKFPHPNVPIELLRRWNAQATSPAEVLPKPRPPTADIAPVATPREPAPAKAINRAPGSSPLNESSDEELYPWSPTQRSPQKPLLPPDSSVASNSRPSTAEERITAATTASEFAERTVWPLPKRNWDLPPDSSAVSPKPSQPPGKFDKVLHSNSNPPPQERLLKRPQSKLDRDEARSSTSEDEKQRTPPSTLSTAFMRPSPRAIKRPKESPTSTFGNVVKSTQLNKNDEDEMEVAVPRSLDQDPAVAHRQRRSEHFKAAQRREWIKANFTSNAQAKAHFSRTYSAYKKAHPKDTLKLSEFAEAIEDVFPPQDASPTRAASSSVPTNDVSSTFSQIPPAPVADVDGIVATPQAVVSRHTMTGSTTRSSGSGRVLPWASGEKNTPGSGGGLKDAKAPASSLFREFKRPASLPSQHVASAKPSSRHMHSLSHDPVRAQVNTAHVPQTPRPRPPNNITKPAHSDTNHAFPVSQNEHPPALRKTAHNEKKQDKHASSNTLAEFAQAWKNLRPGGAFAQVAEDEEDNGKGEHKREERRKPLGPRLDVLRWEL